VRILPKSTPHPGEPGRRHDRPICNRNACRWKTFLRRIASHKALPAPGIVFWLFDETAQRFLLTDETLLGGPEVWIWTRSSRSPELPKLQSANYRNAVREFPTRALERPFQRSPRIVSVHRQAQSHYSRYFTRYTAATRPRGPILAVKGRPVRHAIGRPCGSQEWHRAPASRPAKLLQRCPSGQR
jgi:hypothetical protein